jgi:putative addiction module antidote
MVALKLRQVGDEVEVVIPREVLVALRVGAGDTLYLTSAPDGGLRITARQPGFVEQMTAAERVMDRRRSMLRGLPDK